MREIPSEMADRIESGAATLCHVWILTSVGHATLGFTDHDADLVLDGVTCSAASGWTAGASETRVGLSAGALAASGGLDSEALSETDILAGRFDGARVDLWRVDWDRPDLKVRLWTGRVAKIRRDGEVFVADMEGPMAALDRVVGRTYGRGCDAVLGDARCRADLALHPGITCDKRWETCVAVFDNAINFQGFPDIPGDDFLTAHPAEGQRHDGGSRR
ncbi:DUF2163 domain-containing protein [soil metagenome]